MGKDSRSNGLGVQEIIDYELSRLMCYMVAMNDETRAAIQKWNVEGQNSK